MFGRSLFSGILGRVSFALLAILLLVPATAGFAQSSRGTVTGTVLDPTGAAVAGAEVTLTSPSTGSVAKETTNKAGIYRFDALTPGEYVVVVGATGFRREETTANVTVGTTVGRDFKLTIGSAGESVEVISNQAAELQTEEIVRVQSIAAQQLAELPISGQNSLNLILTAPGVVRGNAGGSLDSGIGAVNGARARSNNFLIDGLQNNDISVAGPQFVIFNNDELQEVSFQTSNFTPEFGRAGGAVVSQNTKSGTNAIHGTIAEVYRSQIFNATTATQRINFNNGSTPVAKNKFKENIPAFTIGGPVIIPRLYNGKDKTFFFGAGQWDRYSSNNTASFGALPTAAGVATLQALASACPNVVTYLASLGSIRGSSGTGSTTIPINVPTALAGTTCNGTDRTGQSVEIGSYVRNAPEVALDNNHLIRIDHVVSRKQNMMFRWLFDNTTDSAGGTVGVNSQFDVPFQGRTMGANFNDIYAINNHVVNEFRFGFVRANIGFFVPASSTIGATAPQIAISSLSTLQLSTSFPQGRISNSFEYQDSITYTHGKHAFKFGVEFLRQLAVQVAPFNGRGTVAYNAVNSAFTSNTTITGLANFIDNFGGTSSGPVNISFGSGKYRPNLFTVSAFFQDTYKATSDLTLLYGMRYENFGMPANIFKYPAFVGYGDTDITSTARVDKDNNNFGPTVGFSYNPHLFGSGMLNGSTVIRGGYQVTYDTLFNNILSNLTAGSPNALANTPVPSVSSQASPRGSANLSSVLPTLVPVAVNPYSQQASVLAKNLHNPYYHHFTFGFQQEVVGHTVLDVAYVGTLGRQLYFTNPLNPVLPNATFTATATQATALYGTQSLRLHANRGLIQIRDSGLTSNYHALQVQLRRRGTPTPAGTLYFSTSYTWSKNLDVLTEVFGTNSGPQNPSRSPALAGPLGYIDYGPSDNDRRHVSSTILSLDVRGPKHGFLGQVLGGWTVASILAVQSGTPFTVINGSDRDFDGSTLGDRPDIGNIKAPINTIGRVTSTANCSSGLYNPAISSTPASACVTRNDVHFVQVTTYSPTSGAMESRNSNTTTRYLNLDTNLLKKFSVTERFKAELRGEFFNVTNNQNFDTPSANRDVTNSAAVNFLNYGIVSGGSRTFRVGGKILF